MLLLLSIALVVVPTVILISAITSVVTLKDAILQSVFLKDNGGNTTFIFLLIMGVLGYLAYKFERSRGKYRKRRYFPTQVREEVLDKQNNRCTHCNKPLKPHEYDFHHKDGKRSNIKKKNCQALCLSCHARKTRVKED